MDLTQVRGIGPAYAERLRAAGIRDAEALAGTDDLATLARDAAIPEKRLGAARDSARAALSLEDSGIAVELPGERAAAAIGARIEEWASLALTMKEAATARAVRWGQRVRALVEAPIARFRSG